MGLNARSKKRIRQGAEHIRDVISRSRALSREMAKDELRNRRIYQTIQDVTLRRIGEHGEEEGWYKFDEALGFWPVGMNPPVGYMRDHVARWAEETAGDNSKKRGAIRSAVERVLLDLDDPTLDQDAVVLAQKLNEERPQNDEDLGSFRSFVRWGLEEDLLKGDLGQMVPPEDLVEEGLRKGQFRARIYTNTMTDTKGRWLWDLVHPDKRHEQVRATVSEMHQKLEKLAATLVDLEEINIEDLLDEATAAPQVISLKERFTLLRDLFKRGMKECEDALRHL